MMSINRNRFIFLDQLRGFTIVLMIIFHFCYDLNYFKFVSIDFLNDKLWYYFPRLITFIFLICVGMSLRVVHYPKIKYKSLIKRTIILAILAVTFSVATYYFFPKTWIYFGILHCICIGSVIGILFLKIPVISGIIGFTMMILSLVFGIDLPFWKLPHGAMDYIPLFPWLGSILIGVFLHRIGVHELKTSFFKFSLLQYLGKRSLLIYILHQPILFGIVFLSYKAMKWIS